MLARATRGHENGDRRDPIRSGRGTAVSEPALGIVQAAKVASVQAQAGTLILDGRRPHSLGWQHSTAQVFQQIRAIHLAK